MKRPAAGGWSTTLLVVYFVCWSACRVESAASEWPAPESQLSPVGAAFPHQSAPPPPSVRSPSALLWYSLLQHGLRRDFAEGRTVHSHCSASISRSTILHRSAPPPRGSRGRRASNRRLFPRPICIPSAIPEENRCVPSHPLTTAIEMRIATSGRRSIVEARNCI